VLILPSYLRTLPQREYLQGTAEILKYGAALDARLFRRLARSAGEIRRRKPGTLVPIIARCCALKAEVVRKDERESGHRRILNFGHTIGHALEAAARYRLSHGSAVAIGMTVEAGISRAMGLLRDAEAGELASLLRAYGLPLAIPSGISRKAVLQAIGFDKKRSGGPVLFTLLGGIGRGLPGIAVPSPILEASLS
jgi:3-dehydroquinate synthase